MLFNSVQFAIFFVVVYGLYLGLNHRWQNRLLLAASYFFYGCWDWRFLFLLILTTGIDYICAVNVERTEELKVRKRWLAATLVSNLVILGFFKYFNFFAENLEQLLGTFGWQVDGLTLRIILPVGISFYTFQSMSYAMDVYRGRVRAIHHFLDFALFIVFFPQLVAGPIERSQHLSPQITNPRSVKWKDVSSGLLLMLWGLFKKVMIADNLAKVADSVFSQPGSANGAAILVAVYAFAFQIYCDFSGYSDMARGMARMMGFDIMINFRFPYFSNTPREFWKRWHISLSTWLRDYLYIPLGGNRSGSIKTYRNLMGTMLIGGLWHGAAWTFVIWGALHGVYLSLQRFFTEAFRRVFGTIPFFKTVMLFFAGVMTFHLICLGWLFFRAQSLSQAADFLQLLFHRWTLDETVLQHFRSVCFYAGSVMVIEFFQQWTKSEPDTFRGMSLPVACVMVFMVSVFTFLAGGFSSRPSPFLYFQF